MLCHECREPMPAGDWSWECPPCRGVLAERKRRANLTLAQREYEDQFGREALERQEAMGREYLRCCGERVADGHHSACSLRPGDAPLVVHAEQQTLA